MKCILICPFCDAKSTDYYLDNSYKLQTKDKNFFSYDKKTFICPKCKKTFLEPKVLLLDDLLRMKEELDLEIGDLYNAKYICSRKDSLKDLVNHINDDAYLPFKEKIEKAYWVYQMIEELNK